MQTYLKLFNENEQKKEVMEQNDEYDEYEEYEEKYLKLVSKIQQSIILKKMHSQALFSGNGIYPANKRTEALCNYYLKEMNLDEVKDLNKYLIPHYIKRTSILIDKEK